MSKGVMIVCLGACVAWSAAAIAAGPKDRDEDLRQLLADQLDAGKKRVVIPPGRYRVKPLKRQHLVLSGLSDVTIVADGVEMICTETTRALTISRCRNVTLRGLTIDYDPLPFTQGKIVKLSDDRRVHEIELFAGYPPAGRIVETKYEIFRPDTRTLRFGSYYNFKVDVLSPRRFRLTRKGSCKGEQVGDIIAIGASRAPGGSIPHAVYAEKCEALTLDNITLYASNCFGFLASECSGTTFRRCRVDRRAPKIDLKRRASARIRSLNADAYHSKHARVGPAIIECVARFQGDDCVAINGDYHMVMKAGGKLLRVLAKRRMNIVPGDVVELFSYQGVRLPDAKAVSVEADGKRTLAEEEFIARQGMNAGLKARDGWALRRAYSVTLDRAVELPMGSLICSAGRVGNGFKVVGCTFGFNRSRGAIIKAGAGEIRDNRFEGCAMTAILLAPEYWWLEGGSGNDVRVTGNTITRCGQGIAVFARGGRGKLSPPGAHRNITITGNAITATSGLHIRAASTRGLVLRNNKCDPKKIKVEQCTDITRDP
jgi:hypothetical protein